MKSLKDGIYGEEKISEPVLTELINSKEIQRLKGISQFGLPPEYYHKRDVFFTRFDHSLGVLILLRRLNADIKEQISGLLHDVSHTAFSHIVDWVFGDPTKENYHDENHLKFIASSKIPVILKRYGFDFKEIMNGKNFPLLEREQPFLCADRIDYTLRELQGEEGKRELVSKIFSSLVVKNSQIVFNDKSIAEIFAREYARLNKEHWAGFESIMRYDIFSKILKKAIDEKIITLDKMKTSTDYEIIHLLKRSRINYIIKGLKLLSRQDLKIREGENGLILNKKFRFVDPRIVLNNKISYLSEVSPNYSSFLEEEKKYHNRIRHLALNEMDNL